MAIRLGPTTAGKGGESLTDADWAQLGRALLGTGVVQGATIAGTPGGELFVTAGGGLVANVATGQAWIYGVWMQSDAVVAITLTAADPSLPRIDRLVVRKDVTANPMVTIALKTGTPAASPSAPALTQNETVWEFSLAQCRVNAASGTITSVTDERVYARSSMDVIIGAGNQAAKPLQLLVCQTLPAAGVKGRVAVKTTFALP